MLNRRHTKKPISLNKNAAEFAGKKENGLAGRKKDKTERITAFGRRTRDSKVESNDSSEIPDRGEISDISSLPFRF